METGSAGSRRDSAHPATFTGRSTTAFSMLNTTAFAPIPSASVTIAVTVNPGDFHNFRNAILTLPVIFAALGIIYDFSTYTVPFQSSTQFSAFYSRFGNSRSCQRLSRSGLRVLNVQTEASRMIWNTLCTGERHNAKRSWLEAAA